MSLSPPSSDVEMSRTASTHNSSCVPPTPPSPSSACSPTSEAGVIRGVPPMLLGAERLVVGKGTYGVVYKYTLADGRTLAVKECPMNRDSVAPVPVTTLREIKLLHAIGESQRRARLRGENMPPGCENIISLVGAFVDEQGNVNMAMEYCEHNLTHLLAAKSGQFELCHLKWFAHELLKSLFYLHSNGILHRDVKGQNVLVTRTGAVKLADFGLGKVRTESMTPRVCARWYRPPELLLLAESYGAAVDCWGAGCVIAEMFLGAPLMSSRTELAQLDEIFTMCGTPDTQGWFGVEELPGYQALRPRDSKNRQLSAILRARIAKSPYGMLLATQPDQLELLVHLVDGLLALDPSRRLSASDALDHDFFWEGVLPESPCGSLVDWDSHEHRAIHQRDQQRRASAAAAAAAMLLPSSSCNASSSCTSALSSLAAAAAVVTPPPRLLQQQQCASRSPRPPARKRLHSVAAAATAAHFGGASSPEEETHMSGCSFPSVIAAAAAAADCCCDEPAFKRPKLEKTCC